MELRLEQLESLYWLWLVLGAVLALAWGVRARRRSLAAFADVLLARQLAPQRSSVRQVGKAAMLIAAMVLLVFAAMDPRWGVRYEDVHRRGSDMLFVIDVSRSMLAEDAQPNRLDRAKQFVGDVVRELAGDRVGIIAFAGTAAVKCPLTVDYGAVRLSLAELSPQTSARGGSLLGDALRLAGESLERSVADQKFVIVLSDGEDQGSYPAEAARALAEEQGVRIFTVGIGDSGDGARIPVVNNGQRTYLTHEQQEVWSRMNPDVLREIALGGRGAFVPAGTSHVDMGRVYHEHMVTKSDAEGESTRVRVYTPRYQWFVGAAIVLLLIEAWMSERRPRPRAMVSNSEQQ